MGTNFYRRKIITRDDTLIMYGMIDSNKILNMSNGENKLDSLENYIQYLKEEVHICKRSSGWKILFDHNWGKYYQPNKESLINFLKEPNTEIVDEYGEIYTFDDFWKMIEDWNSDESLIDSKKYNEKYPSDYPPMTYEIERCKDLFNVYIDSKSDDFYVDNLRFSVFSDFS